MSWYLVDVTCRCGQVHSWGLKVQIPNGPTRAGTVAELYPNAGSHKGEALPGALRELLNARFWCNEAKQYLELEGPERIAVRPMPVW